MLSDAVIAFLHNYKKKKTNKKKRREEKPSHTDTELEQMHVCSRGNFHNQNSYIIKCLRMTD